MIYNYYIALDALLSTLGNQYFISLYPLHKTKAAVSSGMQNAFINKKILFVLSIILVAFYVFNVNSVNNNVTEQIMGQTEPNESNNGIEQRVQTTGQYFLDLNKGIYLVMFPNKSINFNYFLQTEPFKSASDIAKNNNALFVINAGYFQPNLNPAGLLKIGNEIINPLIPGEKQLTHVVTLQESGITIISPEEYEAQENSQQQFESTSFQTGPLIIQDNLIQYDLISNSINGNQEAKRSILGHTSDGYTFFVATTSQYTLAELSEQIINLDVLKNKKIVNAINLDGGTSVSTYSTENKDFAIASFRQIPFYLVISKKDL